MKLKATHLNLIKSVGVLVVSTSAGVLVKNAVRNNLDVPETRKQQLTEKAGLFGIGIVVSGLVASSLNTEIKDYTDTISTIKDAWAEGTKNAQADENVDIRKI